MSFSRFSALSTINSQGKSYVKTCFCRFQRVNKYSRRENCVVTIGFILTSFKTAYHFQH